MARRTAKVETAEIEEAEEEDMMRRKCPKNTSSTMPLLRRMHYDVQKEMAKVTSEGAKRMRPLDPGRCKTSSVCQSAGLLIPRSSVRFRQKLKQSRTQIYMDLNYMDHQAKVLNYCNK